MQTERKCKCVRSAREEFFAEAGPGIRLLKEMMDTLPVVAFYIKDSEGRIMALNPRNCEICNLPDEDAAIGKTSADLFPKVLADTYMARDRAVRETGRPIIGELNTRTSDRSSDPRRISIFPVYGHGNRVIGTASVIFRNADSGWDGIREERSKIEPAIRLIERKYAERVSIPELARLTGLSETHFRRCFKATVGCTPVEYLTTMRINAARTLLETTNRCIADIAQETGFSDHAHFIRTFRAQRDMSPGEYRRQHHDRYRKGT